MVLVLIELAGERFEAAVDRGNFRLGGAAFAQIKLMGELVEAIADLGEQVRRQSALVLVIAVLTPLCVLVEFRFAGLGLGRRTPGGIIVGSTARRLGADIGGRISDDGIEPLPDRHA